MTIPHGLKLHHFNEVVAICVELKVNLEFFSPVMCPSLGVAMSNICMTPYFRISIFCFLSTPLTSTVVFNSSLRSDFTTPSSGPVSKTIHTLLLDYRGLLRKVRHRYSKWDVCTDFMYTSRGEFPLCRLHLPYPFYSHKTTFSRHVDDW